MNNENKKPSHFKVLKVLGFFALATSVVLIILGVTVFADNSLGMTSPNFALLAPGLFLIIISLAFLFSGFAPEIAKLQAKGARYIQRDNKEEFTDIADTAADIAGGAVTKTARAIKEGLKDYKYCPNCGKEIDADASFCKQCGKRQD
jgi:hypothetical protein